jgi:hypothetical protein
MNLQYCNARCYKFGVGISRKHFPLNGFMKPSAVVPLSKILIFIWSARMYRQLASESGSTLYHSNVNGARVSQCLSVDPDHVMVQGSVNAYQLIQTMSWCKGQSMPISWSRPCHGARVSQCLSVDPDHVMVQGLVNAYQLIQTMSWCKGQSVPISWSRPCHGARASQCPSVDPDHGVLYPCKEHNEAILTRVKLQVLFAVIAKTAVIQAVLCLWIRVFLFLVEYFSHTERQEVGQWKLIRQNCPTFL